MSTTGAKTLMNRLASVAVVLVSLAGVGDVARVWGQAAGAGSAAAAAPAAPTAVPPDARTSPAPEAFRPQIDAFVKGHLARVRSTDGAASAASRTAIVAEVTGANTTSSYKDLYGSILASQLASLMSDPDPRVRLQAAILAARVAAASDNTQMAPVASKLLTDSNPAVVLWALKAAKGVLAFQVSLPTGLSGSTLPGQVATAVAKNADRGEIVRDGYEALQLDIAKLPSIRAATIQQLAPSVSTILAARASLYASEFPDFADADREAATFFSNFAFSSMSPAERVQVVQKLSDIVLLSALRGADATGNDQKAMLDHAVNIGKNLYVIAQEINRRPTPQTQALEQSAQFFRNVGPITPPPADVVGAAKAFFAALKAIPEYKSLVEPSLAAK